MSLLKEFKEFAIKGNAIDLAVGVIIGAAFGKIVTSVVEDLIMPPLGLIVGKLDFTNLYIPLTNKITPGLDLAAAKKLGPVLAYGDFLTVLLNFLIIGFCIFLMVQLINRLKRKEAAAPVPDPAPTKSEILLTEIRDALVEKK